MELSFLPSTTRRKNIFSNMFNKRESPLEENELYDKKIFNNTFEAPDLETTSRSVDGSKSRSDRISAASAKLLESYNEDSPATRQYEEYLANQPSQDKFKPSKKRRLGAALAGFAVGLSDPDKGAQLASDIVESPFRNAIKNWERKRIPLHNAAEIESRNRNTKINALKDYIQAEHQAGMDESTIAHRNFLETKSLQDAKKLEEDRLRQDADRDEARANAKTNADTDNTRANATLEETKRANKERERIAAQNAATAADRASAYKTSVDGLNAYRDHLKTKVTTQGNTPSGQKTAEELAVTDIILKPGNSQRYAKFFEQNPTNGRIILRPPTEGMFESVEDFNAELAEYTLLRKEIDDRRKEILAPLRTPSKPPEEKKKRNIQIVPESR